VLLGSVSFEVGATWRDGRVWTVTASNALETHQIRMKKGLPTY